jgi:hypothetical protein
MRMPERTGICTDGRNDYRKGGDLTGRYSNLLQQLRHLL